MMRRVSKKDADSFKSCNRSKSFTKIQTFDLREPFCHKSCFVAYHHPMFILLVSEDPLSAMMFLSFGGALRTQTSLQVKLFNSSCMAITLSESSSASSMLVGSIQETND